MELNIYMMNKAINDFQKKINDIPSRRAQKKRQIRSKAEEKIWDLTTNTETLSQSVIWRSL